MGSFPSTFLVPAEKWQPQVKIWFESLSLLLGFASITLSLPKALGVHTGIH